jgi:hypothetical protein
MEFVDNLPQPTATAFQQSQHVFTGGIVLSTRRPWLGICVKKQSSVHQTKTFERCE